MSSCILDESGFIRTDTDLPETQPHDSCGLLRRRPLAFETSIPGLFAAGDVRHGSVHQAIGR